MSGSRRGHLAPFGSQRAPAGLVREVNATELLERRARGERTLLDPATFITEAVVAHIPVIFRGLARDWPARTVWTDEFLEEFLGDRSIRIETKDDDKNNIPPNTNMREFLRRYHTSDMYMVDETPPPLHRFVRLPEPLRCSTISSKFFVSYMWMSSGTTDSKMHIDTDENMMCVLYGRKTVYLVDPIYSSDLYADEGMIIGVSPIDTVRVDLDRFPRAADAPFTVAVVDPGDCFFLPQNYWHYVHSEGQRNQAVTMWWKSRPIARPELFDFTLERLSFAESLRNYERYVQRVAPLTQRVEHCDREQLSDRREWMSDFEFATDKEDGADFGEDTKGDRDEEDWLNPQARALGLPDHYGHCHFNLSNRANPCFKGKCMDKDDAFGCLRYTLEYCRRFADYGCQDLVWTLNKKGKEEFRLITQTLPDLLDVPVERWPAKAWGGIEAGDEDEEEEGDTTAVLVSRATGSPVKPRDADNEDDEDSSLQPQGEDDVDDDEADEEEEAWEDEEELQAIEEDLQVAAAL